jgi:hypothetical protein
VEALARVGLINGVENNLPLLDSNKLYIAQSKNNSSEYYISDSYHFIHNITIRVLAYTSSVVVHHFYLNDTKLKTFTNPASREKFAKGIIGAILYYFYSIVYTIIYTIIKIRILCCMKFTIIYVVENKLYY